MNATISDLIRISAMLLLVFLFSRGGNSRKVNGRKFAPPVEISYQQAIKEWKSNFGIGPVTKMNLRNPDETLAKKGMAVYQEKCTACHAPDKDKLGPAPEGIMSRRTPEWIMNMILNPVEMVTNDPIAKGLLKKYSTIMTDQKLTEEEAKAVLA